MPTLLVALLCWLSAAFAMPPDAFATLSRQVEEARFSSERSDIIQLAASTNTFTCDQARALIAGMSFSSDQLAALEVLAPRLEDPQNKHLILGAFKFSSDKDEATAILSRASGSKPAATSPPPGEGRAGAPSCAGDAALPPLEVRFSSTWSDADMAALTGALREARFSKDKLDVLRLALQGRVNGFSAPQVRAVLDAFGFSSDMVEAIRMMDDHLLGLTSADVVSIVTEFSFSKDQLAALDVLKDTITDADHKFVILDAFTFSSDKSAARAMLEGVRPRSFLFGTVHSAEAVFVIDVSGSMEASFRTNQGRSWTRLDFVRCELSKVLTEQLPPTAKFNVVLFSEGVTAWRGGLATATPENVADALSFVAEFRPRGGTNLYGGLQRGFGDHPDAVYLLTDGAPTAGEVQDPRRIAESARQWSGEAVPVYSIAFLTGSHQADDKPASRQLMQDIAAATGGIYRGVE